MKKIKAFLKKYKLPIIIIAAAVFALSVFYFLFCFNIEVPLPHRSGSIAEMGVYNTTPWEIIKDWFVNLFSSNAK